MAGPRPETLAERSRRLVSISGGDGRVPPPPPTFQDAQPRHSQPQQAAPKRRSPTRLAAAAAMASRPAENTPRETMKVPQYTPAQMQAFLDRENAKIQAEAQAARKAMDTGSAPAQGGMEQLRSFVGNSPRQPEGQEEPQVHVSAVEKKPVSTLSSWDKEVLEIAEQLDPSDLMMNGEIVTELDILPGVFSITVKSLKKADWTAVNRDVNDFRRGIDTEVETASGGTIQKTIVPFQEEVMEFSQQRHLAQGILGINGHQLSSDWGSRMQALEELPSPAYDAALREYTKFLHAVGTLFPDDPTKQKMEELKARLGKV